MPSPFPGMDPFIEGQFWSDFHLEMIASLRAALVPQLRPKYIANVERNVFLIKDLGEYGRQIVPDVHVVQVDEAWDSSVSSASTATLAGPLTFTLPMSVEQPQAGIRIIDREQRRVVTAIEVLPPWNKTGDGRQQYLEKRDELLASSTNLVEIDLLRGGQRLPTIEELPKRDFFAFVSRYRRLPNTHVYAWMLRDGMPSLPIPLADDDPDVTLDLQLAFNTTYERAGYDYSLNYKQAVKPSLSDADQSWLAELMK
ncbi:MAG: hypothetical protein CMJ78_27040 [Planctomycetaceae bacterium]|nr:hypothetical protein [Planctomycetaceae bacterium]